MTIIKSLSGIRGTIGGKIDNSFSPMEIINFSSGYFYWIKKKNKKKNYLLVIGRDGRLTSKLFQKLVIITIRSLGGNIMSIGLSTTPTVGISIINEKADGGIMITASHNPKNWNGIKLFNSMGEFLSENEFIELSKIVDKKNFRFATYKKLGHFYQKKNYIQNHIDKILSLPIINKNFIKKCNLKIVVDGINSTGGIAVPILLKSLGINVVKMNCNPNGDFAHDPEPIKKNLKLICKKVPELKADLGISVDPDVDRVVFVCENGEFFGEEYTLISIADFILKNESGPVVTTLSSSHVLKKICIKKGISFFTTSVGEVNVVKKMKSVNAIIGGEGNGGIIYPKIRYGRDALVAIALFLTNLSSMKNISLSKLKKKYPIFFMSKKRIQLSPNYNYSEILKKIKSKYKNQKMDFRDGIKIHLLNDEWIHIRNSNTENIIRIYTESPLSKKRANDLVKEVLNEIKNKKY
ncbi:phosphoglucosamine mutase [Blattabacterium cuenoti]|uniref:phosphoglucosamine mutase n=1 Tax=Blattabacterium cuenoti TaxID=1653831 RepID=UPI00163D273D|nr:phosphoglucosamine mutase [Blattabacterium cuenoti]